MPTDWDLAPPPRFPFTKEYPAHWVPQVAIEPPAPAPAPAPEPAPAPAPEPAPAPVVPKFGLLNMSRMKGKAKIASKRVSRRREAAAEEEEAETEAAAAAAAQAAENARLAAGGWPVSAPASEVASGLQRPSDQAGEMADRLFDTFQVGKKAHVDGRMGLAEFDRCERAHTPPRTA